MRTVMTASAAVRGRRSRRPSASRTWRRCRACAPTSSSATGWWSGSTGTGDQTSQAPFTIQSLTNMLAQLGVTVPTNVTPQLKNVAAVSVHAMLPAFVKPGQTIDITVNSIANAKSLRGGSLLVTPLHGLDGQIYAIAQGNLIVAASASRATTARSSPSTCRARDAFLTVRRSSVPCRRSSRRATPSCSI